MPPRRKPASADASRLTVLATTDERAFTALALELLQSRDRLQREAALEALAKHPTPAARDALRAAYLDLDGEGTKHDQGGKQRANILRFLLQVRDPRDADIAALACDRVEALLGEDVTFELRTLGLRLLAALAPDRFPYYAVEHLDDANPMRDHLEPAATAIGLLAGMGHHVALYQWLRNANEHPPTFIRAFEAFSGAPPEFVARLVENATASALRAQDETLCTVIAESVVQLELESSYPALESMLSAKISDELYGYLAMLIAATNRLSLLSILERQLRRGRRPRLVLESLRVRTTDEQQKIIRRWEERDFGDEPDVGRA